MIDTTDILVGFACIALFAIAFQMFL